VHQVSFVVFAVPRSASLDAGLRLRTVPCSQCLPFLFLSWVFSSLPFGVPFSRLLAAVALTLSWPFFVVGVVSVDFSLFAYGTPTLDSDVSLMFCYFLCKKESHDVSLTRACFKTRGGSARLWLLFSPRNYSLAYRGVT